MARQAAQLVHPDPRVEHWRSTGEITRPFAVANRDPGRPAEPWVAGPQVVVEANPEDVAFCNSVCGEPEAFETERLCRACGPLSSDGQAPLCACGRRVVTRRVVTRRADPVEYGPMVRIEQRDVEVDPETGKVVKVRGKRVIYDRLSRVRRMFPDETERSKRQRLGIRGNPAPDKLFRLAPR